MSDDRLPTAKRHVTDGRRIVAAQRALVARLKAAGHDTSAHEALLDRFERTQCIFEDDLEALKREYRRRSQIPSALPELDCSPDPPAPSVDSGIAEATGGKPTPET